MLVSVAIYPESHPARLCGSRHPHYHYHYHVHLHLHPNLHLHAHCQFQLLSRFVLIANKPSPWRRFICCCSPHPLSMRHHYTYIQTYTHTRTHTHIRTPVPAPAHPGSLAIFLFAVCVLGAYSILCGILSELISHVNEGKPRWPRPRQTLQAFSLLIIFGPKYGRDGVYSRSGHVLNRRITQRAATNRFVTFLFEYLTKD